VVALIGTQIHQKSAVAKKTSFQNVPHLIFTDSFRVSTTLKPLIRCYFRNTWTSGVRVHKPEDIKGGDKGGLVEWLLLPSCLSNLKPKP
jgi:hypothetical protein